MSRKEAINTFTDGLISDLNPINTPNTVLTDCLNGTLITYDGNEYTLQNDKGNFPLKDCKLPENYIPVGVKEYGDILYIVSYNPITKHVQIGSYPSPDSIIDEFDLQGTNSEATDGTYDNALKYSVDSLWTQIGQSPYNGQINYSELTEVLERLKLFYGTPPDKFKLNPGDMYKLVITDGQNNNPSYISNLDLGTFEGIEFYIFDENRKPYDITNNVEVNTDDQVYTNWKVPGYMATKLRFGQVDDFKVNTRKVIVPTYHVEGQSAVKELSLNFQYFISDYLYNNHITQTQSALKVKIQVYNQYGNIETAGNISINNGIQSVDKVVDLKNGTFCYYSNWTLSTSHQFNTNDVITLKITPYVEQNNRMVFYDKFERILTFDLSQKGNVNDFAIGEGVWRYTVDDKLVLYFDTSGIQETSVMSQDVELQYKIKRVSELSTSQAITSWASSTEGWSIMYDWNVVGDSILRIDFDPWTGVIDLSKIYAEDYYRIAFRFVNPENNGVLRQSITKTILATELLNGNSAKRYDQIYFDEWINNYSDHIKNKYVNVNARIDELNQTTFIEKDAYYNIWMSAGHVKDYPTFKSILDEIDTTTNPNPEFVITGGINFNTTIDYTSNLELPIGPLWQGLSSTINYTDSSHKEVSSTTGKVDNTNPATENQVNKLEKKLRYSLKDSSIVNTLCNFKYEPINISPQDEVTIEANGIYENQISSSGGPDPDLDLKVCGVAVSRLLKDSSSYFDKASTLLLSKLSDYDMLFLTISMKKQVTGEGDESNPNYNSLRFKTGDTIYSQGDTIYACASNSTGSDTYYGVIKIKDASSGKTKLLFIPIGSVSETLDTSNTSTFGNYGWNAVVTASGSKSVNYALLLTWAQNIKHLKGDGTKVIGGFYKAVEKKSDTNTPIIYITTSPYLSFSSWTYLSKNLFLESERSLISADDNFFKTKGNPNQISLFSGISFSEQTTELMYSGSTSELDELLNDEKTAIAERNAQVSEESLDASEDIYLNRYKDDPDIDLFIDETDPNGLNIIVKFLNKQLTSDTPVMFITTDHWNPPKYNGAQFANGVYTQYNYIGVVESGVTINPNS